MKLKNLVLEFTDLGTFRRMAITADSSNTVAVLEKEIVAKLEDLRKRGEYKETTVKYIKNPSKPNFLALYIEGKGATDLVNKFKGQIGKRAQIEITNKKPLTKVKK